MTVSASLQLRRYCAARVDGQSIDEACAASGIGAGEADFTAIAAITQGA